MIGRLTKISLLLALALPAFAADPTAQMAAPPSIGFSVLRMIGALFVVFSLLFGGVWVYRNSSMFKGALGRNRPAKLKVLETRSLGHRHSIAVVGYNDQRLLLATSPTGVALLAHLAEEHDDESDTVFMTAPQPNFASAFLQALSNGRK